MKAALAARSTSKRNQKALDEIKNFLMVNIIF